MMKRKVLIMRDKRRCVNEADLIAILQRDHGFELVNRVRSISYVIGWLDADRIEAVRIMPEVVCISDDYPFLDHNYQGVTKDEQSRDPNWEPTDGFIEVALARKIS